jgi:hypothetical protein
MTYQDLIDRFWQQYSREIKAAGKIHELFEKEGEHIANDHVALRTFDDPRVDVDVLAKPFLEAGYEEKDHYDFPVKKLFAKHYQHKTDKNAPKVFISQLLTKEFSSELQKIVKDSIDKIPTNILNNPKELLFCKTPWEPLSYSDYEKLFKESQYAAWMYVFGYRVNHFTVSVNHFKKYNTVAKVNEFLKSKGFTLNGEEGEVKGSPQELLEQSSIMAEKKPMKFKEGTFTVPSCYYEFAFRYPDKDGHLYQGFVAASADKIFESTDRK